MKSDNEALFCRLLRNETTKSAVAKIANLTRIVDGAYFVRRRGLQAVVQTVRLATICYCVRDFQRVD